MNRNCAETCSLYKECIQQRDAEIITTVKAILTTDRIFATNHVAGMPITENMARRDTGEYGP